MKATQNDSIDLYEILQLKNKNSTNSEIKRAYYRLALIHHPDKQSLDKNADTKASSELFHKISLAYKILSSEEDRTFYDRTGCIPNEEESGESWSSWSSYFSDRNPITDKQIESLRDEYVGSQEEAQDLLKIYVEYKGNFDAILERLLFSEPSSYSRYRNIIEEQIQSPHSSIARHEKFFDWKESAASKKRRIREEKASTKANQKKVKSKRTCVNNSDINNLVAQIQAKKGSTFIDQLEEKYSSKKKGNKNSK